MPEGTMLLSDPRFNAVVDRILSESELRISPQWFEGRRVLDAGCGNGRWVEGFVRLGCDVTAVDQSESALQQVRDAHGDRVRALEGDVLEVDRLLAGETFDLVFCWGVLHHTEDPAGGIRALAKLVAPDGLLYLYLYGSASMHDRDRRSLSTQRWLANLLPRRLRRWAIEHRYGKDRAHGVWDSLSTPLNQRFSLDEAKQMIEAAGLRRIVQTTRHTELFLRADRGSSSADPYFLPEREPPFWLEDIDAAFPVA
ncbi:MAG: methyltransferase domain-containing protein [Dehalococcoidia bacterium]